jgi:CRP/FNR family transcriptional regulator
MSSGATSPESDTRVEDRLGYLPVSATTAYSKGQVIFGPQRPSKSIYLALTGAVAISHVTQNGPEVLLEIVRPDELFGESAFLDIPRPLEQAMAIDQVTVMEWSVSEIAELVMQRPRLGVALLQTLVQRNLECNRRIQSFSLDTIERRLARSLIRFSERLGAREEDGSTRMMPITHEMLSRYVGTSREVISHYMNRFRRRGCLEYSRSGIVLRCDSLKTLLD